MYDHREDGLTHINVYSKANSLLGRSLSNFALSPFEVPEHGKFMSVEGYWYWLGTKDDKLRHLYGAKAKQYGEGLKDIIRHTYEDREFQALIRMAIAAKLDHNAALTEALRKSKLPFDHYYVYGNKKVDAGYDWIIEWLTYCRAYLKNNPQMAGKLSKPIPKGTVVRSTEAYRPVEDYNRLYRTYDDHTFAASIYTWTVGLIPVKYHESEISEEGKRVYGEERHKLIIAPEHEQVLYGCNS